MNVKALLLSTLFFVSLYATAQTQYSKVIEVPGKAADLIYKFTMKFGSDKDRLFLTNKNVKDRRWVYGREMWGSRKKTRIGLSASNDQEKEISSNIILAYQSGSANSCIQLMVFTADLTIKCNNGQSKIDIANIKYAHYNTGAPPTVLKITDENYFCKGSGRFEDLLECKTCKMAVKPAVSFLEQSIHALISDYEKELIGWLSENE